MATHASLTGAELHEPKGVATAAAGQIYIADGVGSGAWSPLGTDNLPSGSVVQVVNAQISNTVSGTTAIPYDDTIPQNTEGIEVFTLAITPKSASNKLKFSINLTGASPNASWVQIALFKDSDVNAIAASTHFVNTNYSFSVPLNHFMTAPGTGTYTFKVRIGCSSAFNITVNGTSGVRRLGGVAASSITIEEIKA